MKHFLTLILLASSFTAFAQKVPPFNYKNDFNTILGKTKDTTSELSYDKLLKRFTTNAAMTDYEVLALMIGFTDKPAYKPYDDITVERKIYTLNGEEKYQQALDTANVFLRSHPLSLKVLFEKSYAFHKLDQKDSANYYLTRGRRIISAMNYSGDGKTKESAMFALGPADGQDYIYKELSGNIGTMGSGSDKDGNFLDILQVKPESGKPYYLYFNIQHATAKMFSGKSIKDELEELKRKEGEKLEVPKTKDGEE